MATPTLEQRIQRLEDIDALKQLKSRYALYCDDDYDAARLAPLFTSDAVWDGGVLGRFEGREAIRTFFSGAAAVMPFSIHHVTNSILEIDGDHATGQWHLWQPCVHAVGDTALWMAGRYHDTYVREEDGEWRFAKVVIELRMLSPYEAGWSKARMIEVPT
jgi:ketosteroid isomerase-like protein